MSIVEQNIPAITHPTDTQPAPPPPDPDPNSNPDPNSTSTSHPNELTANVSQSSADAIIARPNDEDGEELTSGTTPPGEPDPGL